ncbi:MAG TPA: (2Fe-2S)-binding protein [Desulfosporosinus sp.]|nr:(2Fe-2S)-binding protein [Desulfosporosinus sp.]
MNKEQLLVCRCEEITDEEIRKAIKEGANSVTGIKRRTRAGMGLCQGKTCQKLVERILTQETGRTLQEILPSSDRPPVRPISFGMLGGGEDD